MLYDAKMKGQNETMACVVMSLRLQSRSSITKFTSMRWKKTRPEQVSLETPGPMSLDDTAVWNGIPESAGVNSVASRHSVYPRYSIGVSCTRPAPGDCRPAHRRLLCNREQLNLLVDSSPHLRSITSTMLLNTAPNEATQCLGFR